MNRLYNAVKLDFRSAKVILPPFALTLAICIVIGALTKQPFTTLVVAMMFTTQVGSTIFQVNEKNNLGKLYGVLPLRKIERVLACYLYALILEIGSAVIAIIAALILYQTLDITFDTPSFLTVLGLSFVYYCFSVAFLYPVLMRFTFSKGYLFSMIPIFLMFFIVYVLAKNTVFLANARKFVPFFITHQYLIILFSGIIGIIILTVSFLIACPLAKREEL